jgi:P-aminobenzoate N-oxygenase AurF
MPEPAATLETLATKLDVTYDWSYANTRADLRALYEKAKRSQWLPDEKLPWDTDVDLDRAPLHESMHPLFGTDMFARMTEKERTTSARELFTWILSQFLHGEQGALMAASQLVLAVPDTDSKFYASTQVVDEGRHVEVYARYLHEKVGTTYPVSPHLKQLLDLILTDGRWDMKLLGMQIMVEGLALASFGMIRQVVEEPLIQKLIHYVMLDEARHVAYGVLSLRNHYSDMKESERMEREDFVYEAAVLMRDRFLYEPVWEKLGMPVAECVRLSRESASQLMFRQMLFSKIVPALKKMDLLSPRQRTRFEALGILQFEHWADPFESLAETSTMEAPA